MIRSRRNFLSPPRPTWRQVAIARRAMACEFSVVFPAGQPRPVDAGCAALDEVERLEAKLSVYLADSDISYVNRCAGEAPVTVDEEILSLCQTAARITDSTGGAFDITTGTLLRAWGFFRGPKRIPGESERLSAMASTGMAHVELDPERRTVRYRRNVEINLGSIGKGYAIDRALDRIGATCALMQGGRSSLKGIGAPPGEPRGWKVAIGNHAAVWLKNRALGTSGAAHQFFMVDGRRYGHVLDPRTGWPADGLASASALAPTATEADALSTAFFVLGVEGTRRYCKEHPGIGAVLVTSPDLKVIKVGTEVES